MVDIFKKHYPTKDLDDLDGCSEVNYQLMLWFHKTYTRRS